MEGGTPSLQDGPSGGRHPAVARQPWLRANGEHEGRDGPAPVGAYEGETPSPPGPSERGRDALAPSPWNEGVSPSLRSAARQALCKSR